MLIGEDFPSIASTDQAELSRGIAKHLNHIPNEAKSQYGNNTSNGGRNRSESSSTAKYQLSSGYANYRGGSQKYQPRQTRPKKRPFRPPK